MRFQVPQFIEVEDKIVGRLTLKQFLYLAGGAGASVALYIYIPIKILAILLIIPMVAFSLALAFYKINKKPFIDVVQAYLFYFFADKLYLWRKAEKKPTQNLKEQPDTISSLLSVPKLSGNRLEDLSWSLDVKESLNPTIQEEDNAR